MHARHVLRLREDYFVTFLVASKKTNQKIRNRLIFSFSPVYESISLCSPVGLIAALGCPLRVSTWSPLMLSNYCRDCDLCTITLCLIRSCKLSLLLTL